MTDDELNTAAGLDHGPVDLPPTIDEQSAAEWWLGFNYGIAMYRAAIRAKSEHDCLP